MANKKVPSPIQGEPKADDAGVLEYVNEADLSEAQQETVSAQAIPVAQDPSAVQVVPPPDDAVQKAQRKMKKAKLKAELAALEAEDPLTDEDIAEAEAELARERKEARALQRGIRSEDFDEDEE